MIGSTVQITATVGVEAAKMVVPVGTWALQQGFKVAVGALTKGSGADSRKAKRRPRTRDAQQQGTGNASE
jgi:hypothetical protein